MEGGGGRGWRGVIMAEASGQSDIYSGFFNVHKAFISLHMTLQLVYRDL